MFLLIGQQLPTTVAESLTPLSRCCHQLTFAFVLIGTTRPLSPQKVEPSIFHQQRILRRVLRKKSLEAYLSWVEMISEQLFLLGRWPERRTEEVAWTFSSSLYKTVQFYIFYNWSNHFQEKFEIILYLEKHKTYFQANNSLWFSG